MRNVRYIELNQDVIKNIKDSLYKNNISRSKLADMIGITKGTMSQYLNGNVKNIGEDILFKIYEVLDIKNNVLENNTISEEKIVYGDYIERPISIPLLLSLAKIINQKFTEDEFKNKFNKTIDKFFKDMENFCIDARVLQELKFKGVDLNNIFEDKTFSDSFREILESNK